MKAICVYAGMPSKLSGKEVHQPTEHESNAYKRAKNLRAVNQPLAGCFLGQNPEYHGDEEGEYNESRKVS